MHTNDMLAGRRLCACVEIETVFTLDSFRNSGSTGQRVRHTSIAALERVTFSDLAEVIVKWSIYIVIPIDTEMSLFQPNCRIENCIPRSFSATTSQTRPLNAYHNTTQQALSTHLYSSVSALSIPDLDEK